MAVTKLKKVDNSIFCLASKEMLQIIFNRLRSETEEIISEAGFKLKGRYSKSEC